MSRNSRVLHRDHDEDEFDSPYAPARPRMAAPAHPGLVARLTAAALAHPVHTLGVFLTAVTMVSVAANAVRNQAGRHPAPMVATRPFAEAPVPVARARVEVPVEAPVPVAVAQPPQKPAAPPAAVVPAADPPIQTASLKEAAPRLKPVPEPSRLTYDLQSLMQVRGFYKGEIDGLNGPATSDAIRLLERSLGLAQTGEASDRLLALARERTLAVPVPPAAPVPPKPIVERREPAPEARAIPVAHAPAAVATPAAKPAVIAANQPAPAILPTDDRVMRVQKALAAAGFSPNRFDGRMDDRTVEAIKHYEASRGWAPTGKLSDRLTLDLMMASRSP